MRVIAPTPFPGAHTRPAPAHAAAISDVLTRASFPRERSRAALEDGTRISAGRLDTSARIALLTPSGHRVALLAVTGSLAEPAGGALLGTAVASAFRLGPEHPDDRPPEFAPASVRTVARMVRDKRTPAPRADGAVRWTVPGAAEVEVNPRRVTISAPAGTVRFSFDGSQWDNHAAAAVVDAVLWQLAPAARHLTGTTEPRGSHYPAQGRHFKEYGVLSAGSMRPGGRSGKVFDYSSRAWCSCGWEGHGDDRPIARLLARNHVQSVTAGLPG